MFEYFPVEILSIIFENVTHDLLAEKRFHDAHRLLLVSTSVQTMVEPILYRSIKDDDPRVEPIFWAVVGRPRLAQLVKRFDLIDEYTDRDYVDLEEEERMEEEDGEDEQGEEEEERKENANSKSDGSHPCSRSEGDAKSRQLDAAVAILKSKFQTCGDSIRSWEDHWTQRLMKLRPDAIQWALLVQLSNLTSLTLEVKRGKLAQMAILLHLPRLETLDFTIAVGGEGKWSGDVSSENILESIISSTNRLKSLRFENISGSCYSPEQHDAEELKEIIDRHAETLESLDIVCGMDDEKDWRMEQECTDIVGSFGSMKHFTRLSNLTLQLEVLLGKPADNEHRLKDVLPPNLYGLTLLNLPDYHGQEDSDRIWEDEDFIPHFEELARAAEDSQNFASLQSVRMHLTRKDEFNPHRSGNYEESILAESRIDFGWF
ncbi:hypothetical protein BJY01DRAFT_98259 [Aspergillus pseudoustus]|uniref:F-box domain-containing protein n=1 Tax=Aspergillus pseudoustus TaxID=1810923 RepID=A0ABR4IYR9_9EURO